MIPDRHAAALVSAGRLLQSPSWPGGRIKIEPRKREGGLQLGESGETYPQAVARVVAALDDGQRAHLRELVAWVLDYQRQEATI